MSLNFEELDKVVINNIRKGARGQVRACALNAIRHLQKAWEIREIDLEMAALRAITAEEEAVAAIFLALREKGYENAKKIKFRNHSYKQALYPFIRAVGKFIADSSRISGFPFSKSYLHFEGEGEDKKLTLSLGLGEGMATPVPPLGFEIRLNGKPYYFDKELLEVTSGESRDEIVRYVKNIANVRNRLLYATSEGIPLITAGLELELEKRKNTVVVFLRLLSLIFPYKKKALFVQQTLNAFLGMMGDIELKIDN